MLILSFLMGHVVQAIASTVIAPLLWYFQPKNLQNYDNIVSKAKEFFKIEGKVTYEYCYLYMLPRDDTGHILIFNSLFGLYRGLFTGTVCLVAGNLLYNILNWHSEASLVIVMLPLFALSMIFYKRLRQHQGYMAKKVYILFDIHLANSKSNS